MTASRWWLLSGLVVVGVAAALLVNRAMPDRIARTLQQAVPPVDRESLRAPVERLAAPLGPRTITLEVPVLPGAASWPELSAEARFFAGPPSCLRSEWSLGTVPHVETVSLPVSSLGGNRFVVGYHDQLLAPSDLYGKGRCGWFVHDIRLVARAVPDRASGQQWQAHVHLKPEAILEPAPQSYACLPGGPDGLVMQCFRREWSGPVLEPLPEVSLQVAQAAR